MNFIVNPKQLIAKIDIGSERLLRALTSIAIVVGGAWTLWSFTSAHTASINAEVHITAEVLPYTGTTKLVILHIKPTNIGKVPIELGKNGISITLRKIPQGLIAGHINTDKLPISYQQQDIVKKYGGYVLEPSVEFDEVQTFILPKGDTYIVEAIMGLDKDEIVNNSFVLQVN